VTSQRRKSPRPATRVSSHLFSSRYFFFGGKGGVGKTTCATASAIFLLKHAKAAEKILLFSTDPAHSVSDSLEKPIGNKVVLVCRINKAKLYAFEMDSRLALESFREKHGKVLAEIAERGTLLDEADIKELLNLSLPGLDEVMALFELSELVASSNYSHIVIDTAPSGHTTRLLRLPDVFARMVTALDRMADKHRYMIAQFVGRRSQLDDVDLFLGELRQRIDRVKNLLYNSQETGFALVAIPEALSVGETKRYFEDLKNEGVGVTDLIINRVEQPHRNCSFCKARVRAQRFWLQTLVKEFKGLRQHQIPLMKNEIRGITALESVGKVIWSLPPTRPKVASQVSGRSRTREQRAANDLEFANRRIWIFGGKGGVGKTTASAAFALSLAEVNPAERFLIFSTDPAHSLSDSFEQQIGPFKERVANVRNLDAMEIDPGKWFEELKARYRSFTDDLFASIAGSSRLEIKFEREAMRELVELTPPGIDEIAALGVISDLIDQNQYHTIILDTAPTGHLIRFLELPEIALSWVRTFIKLLLKYQHIVHANKVAEELVTLSRNIKRVVSMLTDAKLCEFVGVAIPERMSLAETMDLADSLMQLKVTMNRVLINGLTPDSAAAVCSFCRSRQQSQRLVLRSFRAKLGKSRELLVAPQYEEDVRGAVALRRHFASWQQLNLGLRERPAAVENRSKSKRTNERARTEKLNAK